MTKDKNSRKSPVGVRSPTARMQVHEVSSVSIYLTQNIPSVVSSFAFTKLAHSGLHVHYLDTIL